MPTIDELHAADLEHAAAIAAMQVRLDGHDTMIERQQSHLLKLDETIATVRETIGRLATRDDIMDLRKDINGQFTQQLTDAHNSIPSKFAAAFAGIMAALTVLNFVAAHFK